MVTIPSGTKVVYKSIYEGGLVYSKTGASSWVSQPTNP